MTKQELIDHLQHLEQYTHYSEDAPALREVIEMLKCSEVPNSSDTISRQAAIDALDCINGAEEVLRSLPSAQPDLSEYSDKLWRNAYERGKREAQTGTIQCKDCKYLDVQGTYGECGKGLLGIVNRDDFCSRAERREE